MNEPYAVTGDVYVLPSSEAAPGYGVLPVNAFLIADDAPVLVDTGLPSERDEFLENLWSLVGPDDLRWVLLTHEDPDHAGNLMAVLEAAPRTRLVTNYVTVGKLLEGHTGWVNALCALEAGGKALVASGSGDGTVRLWDPATGQRELIVPVGDEIWSVAPVDGGLALGLSAGVLVLDIPAPATDAAPADGLEEPTHPLDLFISYT